MTCVDDIQHSACMAEHQLDGLRSVESGRGSLAGKGERERGGTIASLNCYQTSDICWLVEDTLMFRRGEERKDKRRRTVASGNV